MTRRGQNEIDAADAAGKALVVISSTLQAAAVGGTFRDVEVPVLVWEAFIFDDMKMTGPVAQVDYGSIAGQQEVMIVDAAHPLAAGLAGPRLATTGKRKLIWGRPAATADVVAGRRADGRSAGAGAPRRSTVGRRLGGVAPCRRLGAVRRRGGLGGRGAMRPRGDGPAASWTRRRRAQSLSR